MRANRIVLAVDAASRGVRLWGERLDGGSTGVIRSAWEYSSGPHGSELGSTISTPLLRWNMHASLVHTARVGPSATATHLSELLEGEVIVQPYIPTITTEGEISFVVVGGKVIARSALDALDQTSSYARIDVVGHHVRLVVLELELVEPRRTPRRRDRVGPTGEGRATRRGGETARRP